MFTSDLSVSEYVLLGEAGFEPLGFVVGSSIYHVGLQIGRWRKNQELQVLTQAMYHARELAMARMRAEADHLSADGIVGVQLRMQMYAWGQNCLEFVATGTAVRHLAGRGAHRAPDGRAFTSDLSAQDFFRLLAAGAVPVSFVLGTCVYHIAHQSVMQSMRQAYQNQEMMQFTQGVYEARELALTRMQAEAAQAKASGIVGVTVDVKNHVWGAHGPSSWPPAPPSGGSPTSTACRKRPPSPHSRSAWTTRHPSRAVLARATSLSGAYLAPHPQPLAAQQRAQPPALPRSPLRARGCPYRAQAEKRGGLDVVEADHGQLARDRHAEPFGRREHPDGLAVRSREDRGRRYRAP